MSNQKRIRRSNKHLHQETTTPDERSLSQKRTENKGKKKTKNRVQYWPAKRKSIFRKIVTPSHVGPTIKFNIIKINSYGKKQRRAITLSKRGLSNISGKSTKWFINSRDIYGIKRSRNRKRFTLVAFHRYHFQCQNEGQANEILTLFKKLNLFHTQQNITDSNSDSSDYESSDEDSDEEINENIPEVEKKKRFSWRRRSKKIQVEEPEKIEQDSFEILKMIGKGSFGKVYLVRKKDNQKLYAMKILVKSELYRRKQIEHTKTEQRVLASLDHPFIVKLHHSFQTKFKLYLILDYVQGGELFFHLKRAGQKRFPQELAVFYVAEIVLAIEYLHQKDIVYRDLKPENILLESNGHIKITDFGLSKEGIVSNDGKTEGEKATTICGTAEYLAPEVITSEGHGKAVDWWSVGILIYEMLVGNPPFYSENRNEMFMKAIQAKPPIPDFLSEEAKDIIRKLLTRSPALRLGANGTHEIKSHPFFKNIDWELLSQKRLDPPFKPKIPENDPSDTSCFDSRFTTFKSEDDQTETNNVDAYLLANLFPHFSFSRKEENNEDQDDNSDFYVNSNSNPNSDSDSDTDSDFHVKN
ncbi:non-specific serine/threonine protein kinase [Anaeramoeba ignava]|uniref:Non-specific serine/threonine protein kinase n=1 Tax=Anaeramoeba ignava TaxID=1746090 RepID=A0A9Q0LE07_ANAIG|nr:non-specific serine/threonine protein kinase [Anaeramoeba ignava]